MGLHQFLRRIPGVLRHNAKPATLGHLVDRVDPGVPNLLHRDLHGAHDRRGVLSPGADLRHGLHDRRHILHVRRHAVLAVAVVAGHMHGHRQRLRLLPCRIDGVDVL